MNNHRLKIKEGFKKCPYGTEQGISLFLIGKLIPSPYRGEGKGEGDGSYVVYSC
jgi:hypothetical protein